MAGAKSIVKADTPSFSDHIFRRDKVALSEGQDFLEMAQREKSALKQVALLEKSVMCLKRAFSKANELQDSDARDVARSAAKSMNSAYHMLAESLKKLNAQERELFLAGEKEYRTIYGSSVAKPPVRPENPAVAFVASPLVPAVGIAPVSVSKETWEEYERDLALYNKKGKEFIAGLATECEILAQLPALSPS